MKIDIDKLIDFIEKKIKKYKERPKLWDYDIENMEQILTILKNKK